MATKTLDLQALRALITASDVGGFRQAAAQMNRTPSAVSLQMKRLHIEGNASLVEAVKQGRLDLALAFRGASRR